MRRALRHTAALVLVGLLGAACAEVTPDQRALLDRTVESIERSDDDVEFTADTDSDSDDGGTG